MTMVSDPILDRIERAIAARLPLRKNLIIGISGVDGAGKSTLSKAICDRLEQHRIAHHLIEIDDFLHPRPVRNANPNQPLGYYYETFAFGKIFDQLLIPLSQKSAHQIAFQLVDWPGDGVKTKVFDVTGPVVILVEGVFLFKRAYADVFDLRLWLDISFSDALDRVHRRSRDTRYYKSPEAITTRYLERFYPGQRLHFERDNPKARAHFVIDAATIAPPVQLLPSHLSDSMPDMRRPG